jgi:hypothetical protein
MIPGLTCTNGNKCAPASNLTSSFAIQGNGLNISQTYSVSISGQNFTINGNGANFTKTYTTMGATHSRASPTPKAGLKLLILVGFLLFSTQAFAAASITSADLIALENQYNSVLGKYLNYHPKLLKLLNYHPRVSKYPKYHPNENNIYNTTRFYI